MLADPGRVTHLLISPTASLLAIAKSKSLLQWLCSDPWHLQPALSFRSRTPTVQPLSLLRRRPSTQQQRARTSTIVAVFKSRTKATTTTKQNQKQKQKTKQPRPRVEDGIFGTSGGIGFTKEKELFVGRVVAMLGFAASLLGEAVTGKGILAQLNLETGIPITEAEPRRRHGARTANELFVGRLAQLGIAFSLIDEIVTGKGALAQLNVETGVPVNEIEPLILFSILFFFFFAAINPGTGRFVTDDDGDNDGLQ